MDEIFVYEELDSSWKVTDDNKADWAIERIKEIEEEKDRLINLAEDKINQLKARIDELKAEKDNSTNYFKGLLREYMATVETKSTKTQDTYKLLSGTLKIKRKAPTPIKDDKLLLEWLKSNKMNNYITNVEKANWGEFKKELVQTDRGYVTKDGEVVEGVTLKENDDVFEVI